MKIAKIGWVLCAASIGCGGASTTTPAQHGEHVAQAEHQEHHEHDRMPPEMTAMHDELAPVWHSEPGETRAGLACDHAENLLARSEEVATGTIPEDQDPLEWRDAAGGMRDAASELLSACETPTTALVEEKLFSLHEAFHALKDRLHPHGA